MGDPISDALHRLFPLTGPQAQVIPHPTEADLVALETELGVQATGARRGSTPKPKPATGGDRAARSRAARAAGRSARPAAAQQAAAPPTKRAAGQVRSPAGQPAARQSTARRQAAARQPAARQAAARQPAARQAAARQPAARQHAARQAAARQPAAYDAETMRKLQQYRATLGDINRVPRARQATPAQLQKLDAHARALLTRVNGRQSFADLIASCGLPELHATYYFALLVTHRIIR